MRNLLDATPKALQEEVYQQVRAVLDALDLKTARLLKDAFVEAYAEKALKAVQMKQRTGRMKSKKRLFVLKSWKNETILTMRRLRL